MTNKKLKQLFALARQLYVEEQKSSGMEAPIPFCTVKCNGELLIFSSFGKYSNEILLKLKEYHLVQRTNKKE